MTSLSGKTLFITGASRGIGLEIAKIAAKDGANIVIAAKTAEPHPKLSGTIHTAAAEIEQLGGKALPVVVDVRDEAQVEAAIDKTISTFGGIDILINNASAISLTGTLDTTMKSYDLMNQINARGTYLCSQKAIPHLQKAQNPHILTLSPPLSLNPKWFKQCGVAYTMAKYGMSMCVLGMAEEFKQDGIAVNALWPKTAILTAAIKNMAGSDPIVKASRTPLIMADAAYEILTKESQLFTGNFVIDEQILREAGVTDFSKYKVDPSTPEDKLFLDFYLD
jgi:citronellol/citronellal dehydrogenase